MTFKELQSVFDKYRLYQDRGVVRMVALSVIANHLLGDRKKPFWIVFVAPPGGGKSDVTGTISGFRWKNDVGEDQLLCEEISDLTTTSLASGMRSLDGETSLLSKLNPKGGIMLFKDFTTLLSKRDDDLKAIMSYLREIYDGKFEKKFGNGKIVKWEGKVGLIASCTTIIYHRMQELSTMGERLMLYQVEQPDRMKVQEKIWENEDAGIDGSDEMAESMEEYLSEIFTYIDTHKAEMDAIKIDDDVRKELGDVANFSTMARSGVIWNYKRDTISYVPDPEMPTRVLRALISLANGAIAANMKETGKAILTDNDKKLIYKTAFDSIPNTRRNVIKVVGTYAYGSTLEGLADKLEMQFEAVKVWVEELVAVKIIERQHDVVTKKYKYKLKPEFIEVVKRYERIEVVEQSLEGSDEESSDSSNNGWDAF